MNEAVAVAGGGPVGLLAALELARMGLRPIVLEAREEIAPGSRAICISRRSLEILDRAGAGAAFAAKALPWSKGRTFHRDQLVFELAMPHAPDDRHAPFVNLQQYHAERFLLDALVAEGGADIRWGHRVTGVAQDGEAARLTVQSPNGIYDLSVPWVVAADGARSAVRHALGLPLKGTSYEGRYLIADIEVVGADWPVERRVWFDAPANPGSTVILHVQPDGIWRIDCQLREEEDAEEALSDEKLIPRLQAQLDTMGVTAPWRLIWKSLYRAHALSLDRYRHGRVLFAGDAAHLVPIFGVRGLNSGLDDAHNLAWKLTMVARGEAPDALLDSYSHERRRATAENLTNAVKSTWFMSPPSRGFRIMRDAALVLAHEHEWAKTLINPRQSSFHIYEDSPVVVPDRRPDGAGVQPGAPLPNLPIAGEEGGHLQGALPAQGFTLLVFAEAIAPDERESLLAECGRLGIRPLPIGPGAIAEAFAADAFPAYLIRPDEHVAARFRREELGSLAAALDVAVARSPRPERPAIPTPSRSEAERLESLYESLSLAIDETDESEGFIARLALLFAHELGDESRLRSFVASALERGTAD